jgi:glycine C-acetyltransferase
MVKTTFNYTPPTALTGSLRDYRRPRGSDLQERTQGFLKWRNLRRQHGLWHDPDALEGLDFFSEDYLGLGSHPAVRERALAAAFTGRGGLEAARLEAEVADFLQAQEVLLTGSGWTAAYGAIRGLVRPNDHILVDAHAGPALHEAAAAATRNLYLFRHNLVEDCREWLAKIRAHDAENGVLVATHALFQTDSERADLAALQDLCREFNATLLVDVGPDLGTDGAGVLGAQAMLGSVDLVTGSFSHVFAAQGGFVACRSEAVKAYLRAFGPTLSAEHGMAPAQAAAALTALQIARGPEGEGLRERLMDNAGALRRGMIKGGFELHGSISALACVKLGGDDLARLVARRLPDVGLAAELLEFPATPAGQARLRLRTTVRHDADQIAGAVAALIEAYAGAQDELGWLNAERQKLRVAS